MDNNSRLAYADRLKPLCSQQHQEQERRDHLHRQQQPYLRRRRPIRSPNQNRAREIVRKYRRQVREAEFRRLRSVVPAVADDEKASQVSKKMEARRRRTLSSLEISTRTVMRVKNLICISDSLSPLLVVANTAAAIKFPSSKRNPF